jgi:hypothetical protein
MPSHVVCFFRISVEGCFRTMFTNSLLYLVIVKSSSPHNFRSLTSTISTLFIV